jgi:hypothetical protein
LPAASATPAAGTTPAGPSGPAPATPPDGGGPSDRPTDRPGDPPDAAGRSLTLTIWFTRAGRLFPTTRTRPATPATSRLALTELVAGPTPAEAAAGLTDDVAADTTFTVSIRDGVATVSLPGPFYEGGRDAARLRQAQVVYTLTQFPAVQRVGFQRTGTALGWPVGRADYADLLPAIVVTRPGIGERVDSPVTVAGTADVYEATVTVRVLDAAGAELGTTFTTATCGTGCRGDYSVAVPYRGAGGRPGTVEVFEVSARDGSPVHVVTIPVVLG